MIAPTYTAPGVNAALLRVSICRRKARFWRRKASGDFGRIAPTIVGACNRFAKHYEDEAADILAWVNAS